MVVRRAHAVRLGLLRVRLHEETLGRLVDLSETPVGVAEEQRALGEPELVERVQAVSLAGPGQLEEIRRLQRRWVLAGHERGRVRIAVPVGQDDDDGSPAALDDSRQDAAGPQRLIVWVRREHQRVHALSLGRRFV